MLDFGHAQFFFLHGHPSKRSNLFFCTKLEDLADNSLVHHTQVACSLTQGYILTSNSWI